MKYFLFPFSSIMDLIAMSRRFLYEKKILKSLKINKPVISVGNLSMGGSGKTPFIIALVKYLESKGKKGVILTRGYKSPLENANTCLSDKMKREQIGDEAKLMLDSFNSTILVGKDRIESYQKFAGNLEHDFVLLDDGFQHLKIQRDWDILLIDTSLEREKFKVVPSGYLREHPRLIHQDKIITYLSKIEFSNNKSLEFYRSLKNSGELEFSDKNFYLGNKSRVEGQDVQKEIMVFSSIARPENFIASLESKGFRIQKHFCFEDHSFIDEEKFAEIINLGSEYNMPIICTEKDFVKIESFPGAKRIIVNRLEVSFEKILSSIEQNLKRLHL